MPSSLSVRSNRSTVTRTDHRHSHNSHRRHRTMGAYQQGFEICQNCVQIMRVSQPLWPNSTVTSSVQAVPNSARSYPVLGARPLTGICASSSIAADEGAEASVTTVVVTPDPIPEPREDVSGASALELAQPPSTITAAMPM